MTRIIISICSEQDDPPDYTKHYKIPYYPRCLFLSLSLFHMSILAKCAQILFMYSMKNMYSWLDLINHFFNTVDRPKMVSTHLPIHLFLLPLISHTSAKLSLVRLLSPKINCLCSEWVKTTQRCHYFTAIDHTLGNKSQ